MKFKNFLKAWPKEYKASPKLLSLIETAKKVFEQWGELVHQHLSDENISYINIQDGKVIKGLDPKQPGEQIRVECIQSWSKTQYVILDLDNTIPHTQNDIAIVWSDGKTFEFIRKDYETLPTNSTIANILYLLKIPTKETDEWIRYIDDLLQTPDLYHKVVEQLYHIKMHSVKMIRNHYDMSRIAVENRFVTIDWWWLPKEPINQTYNSMKNDPKGKTYPQYAEALFEMAGAMIGETRDKPSHRDQIQDGTVDGVAMVKALNTKKNKKILTKLRELIWVNGYIPMGFDSDKNVVYVSVRSSGPEFRRHVNFSGSSCLVPSIVCDPHR
jgi:hypothetical protein